MAGLVAARMLHDSGFSVTVLEARERVGGRTWTDDFGGAPIDLGASWIHDADDNPLTEWCAALDIPLAYTPEEHVRIYSQTATLSENASPPANVSSALAGPLDSLSPEPPARGYFEQYVDRYLDYATAVRQAWRGIAMASLAVGTARANQTVAEWQGEQKPRSLADAFAPLIANCAMIPAHDQGMLGYILSMAEGVEGAPYERIALNAWFPHEIQAVNAMPVGGYHQLIADAMAGLDIRLGTPVTHIVHGSDGVSVLTGAAASAGEEFSADAVIVTTPLAMLQSEAGAVEPDQTEAAARGELVAQQAALFAAAARGVAGGRGPHRLWAARVAQ